MGAPIPLDIIAIIGDIIAINKTLIFTSAGARSFSSLPEDVQEAIIQALFVYGLTGEGDVKRMKGGLGLRLRVGDDRVVFEEPAAGLTIVGAGHRREVYR